MAIPIAIISTGAKHPQRVRVADFSYSIGQFGDGVVFEMDLRAELGNPLESDCHVRKGCDGTHESTVVAVYSQPSFGDKVADTVTMLVENRSTAQLVVGACNTSFHRADTYCRTLQASLNAVEIDGEKVFNCMFFPTCGVNAGRDIDKVIENATSWIEEPWTVMTTPHDVTRRYGYEFVITKPKAHANFVKIWDAVEVHCMRADNYDDYDTREYDVDGDDDKVDDFSGYEDVDDAATLRPTPPIDPPRRSLFVPRSSSAACVEPPSSSRVRQAQFVEPPSSSRVRQAQFVEPPSASRVRQAPRFVEPPSSSHGVRQARVVEPPVRQQTKRPIPPPPPIAPKRIPLHAKRARVIDTDEEWHAKIEQLPEQEPWETDGAFTVDMWRAVLAEYGVDKAAQHEVFLLSQYSEAGRMGANDVVAKLLKATADNRTINNPSGFVHKMAQTIRYSL